MSSEGLNEYQSPINGENALELDSNLDIPETFTQSDAKEFTKSADEVLKNPKSTDIERAEACEVAGIYLILPSFQDIYVIFLSYINYT